jgi:hypothetical protein
MVEDIKREQHQLVNADDSVESDGGRVEIDDIIIKNVVDLEEQKEQNRPQLDLKLI